MGEAFPWELGGRLAHFSFEGTSRDLGLSQCQKEASTF